MSAPSPLVSVIVPNYNYARYLPDRMESILNQTLQDFEVILLDDCSTDNSVEVMDRYRNNPHVSQIVRNDHNSGSPFVQWEKGLALARGRYVWIAEADDLAEPHLLEREVAVMEHNPGVVLTIGMSRIIDADGVDMGQCEYDDSPADGEVRVYRGKDFIQHKMLGGNRCYNASMALFRRSAWEGISDKRYLKMRYNGDWDFWIQIAVQGDVAVVQENLSKFRKHGGSTIITGTGSNRASLEMCQMLYQNINLYADTPAYIRQSLAYKILRTIRRGGLQGTMGKCAAVTPDFERFVRRELPRYPRYWLYKHTLLPLQKKLLKSHIIHVLHK